MVERDRYPSDLSDGEWAVLEPLLPVPPGGGRPREYSVREIQGGIFYLSRGDCSWRMLPHDSPNGQTVYHYMRVWRLDGTWARAKHPGQRRDPRPPDGHDQCTRAARGSDGSKRLTGRRRHVLVDTQGLVLGVRVPAGNLSDREGGKLLLVAIAGRFPGLRHLFVNGGYQGKWAAGAQDTLARMVQVVQRPDVDFRCMCRPDDEPFPEDLALELRKKTRGYRDSVVIPRRWVVERTLAWLTFQRRLVQDYEFWPETSESFVHIAMSRTIVRRLAG